MSKFEFRENQVEIVKRIIDAFENGIDNVVLSAPTGFGKSGTALALHKMYNKKSLILNHQKALVDQYDEFIGKEPGVVSIKGKDNYNCLVSNVPVSGALCSMGMNCTDKPNCEYFIKRSKFDSIPLAVTNYQFVFSLIDVLRYKRVSDVAIYDECHNIESIFRDYRIVRINKEWKEKYSIIGNKLNKLYPKNKFKKYKDSIIDSLNNLVFITDKNYKKYYMDFYGKLKYFLMEFESLNLSSSVIANNKELQKIVFFMSLEKRKLCKWENYLETKDCSDWVLDKDDTNLNLIPIDIDKMFLPIANILSKKRVFMSATVIDYKKMIDSLGLDIDKTMYIDIESEFPKENRGIYFLNATSLNYRNTQDKNGYEMSICYEVLKDIINNHKGESGYIFAPSYRLCKIFYEYIRYRYKNEYEVLFNKDGSESNGVLKKFCSSKGKPKILFSPSFTEGVNFSDNISRFQIIMKTPYLSLGSNFVKTKMKRDQQWYDLAALITIMQVSGRSVRHKNDYATTYIIDKNASKLVTKNWDKIPKWYKEACFLKSN